MGTVYIHNRVHLNKTHEAPPPPGMPLAEPPTSDQPPSRNVESKSPLIAHIGDLAAVPTELLNTSSLFCRSNDNVCCCQYYSYRNGLYIAVDC